MPLRLLAIGIVAFWGTMTFLQVKATYFDAGKPGAAPPPEQLLAGFLELEDDIETLQVFRQNKKVGDATLSRQQLIGHEPGSKELSVQGTAKIPIPGLGEDTLSLKAKALLQGIEDVLSADITLRLTKADLTLRASTDQADTTPNLQLEQGGQLLLDSARPGGGLPPSLAWVRPMLDARLARKQGTPPTGLRSRESSMELAGRRRTIYIIEPDLDGPPIFQIFLTENSELIKLAVQGGIELRSLLLTFSQ